VPRKPEPLTRRELDRLAVPAIIGGIAEPLIALADTAFIGQLGSDAAMGAVGIASSFFLLVVWVLAQTRSAVLAAVARNYGEQRLEAITGLVPLAVWTNIALGFVFLMITYPLAEPIFRLYHADGELLQQACAYFRIRALGFPITLAVFAITGALRGMQNLRWNMWISLLGAALNIALNPLLIFGFGPLPAMGIEGSAISSVVAQMVMLLASVRVLHTRTPFRIWPRQWTHPELLPLMLNSGNLFARTIALNVCYYLGNRLAASYGVAHLAAHSIAMQIWLFSAFFIDGYAAAGSVVVGRLSGEGDQLQLYRVSSQVVKRSVLIGAGLAALLAFGYEKIGPIFTGSAHTLALFQSVFWMVIITQPINAVAFAFDGIYKGLAEGRTLRNVLVISTFGVFIPLAWAADLWHWELKAVWTAFIGWMLVRGALLLVHFERAYSPRARRRARRAM
jgi:multidrug resistance protein, MATE family